MGPLSGKLQMKMMLDQKKAQADEARKQEMQDIKIQEASAKANQALQYKARDQAIKEKGKLEDLGMASPVPPLDTGAPEMNGGYELPEGDDQIAAVKTGEAIIPAEAAQDPRYQPIIAQMVNDGRDMQDGYKRGTTRIPKPKGRTGLVDADNMLPTLPTVGSRRKLKGYSQGTTYALSDGRTYTAPDPDDWIPMPGYGNETQMKQMTGMVPAINQAWTQADSARAANQDAEDLKRELSRASRAPFANQAQAAGTSPYDVLSSELNKAVPPAQAPAIQPRPSPEAIMYANKILGSKEMMGTVEQINAQKVITLDRAYSNAMAGQPAVSSAAGMGQQPTNIPRPEDMSVAPVSQAVPEMYTQEGYTETPTEPAGIISFAPGERPGIISGFLKDASPEVKKIQTQADSIADPVEKKGFLEEMLGSLFGKGGLITPRDAMRLAMVTAGGMITGGSTNGSLKYAGLDLLKQIDERESNQYLDDRAKATETKANRAAYAKLGYAIPKIDKFMETNDPADLGAPSQNWQRTSANPRLVTFGEGASSGKGTPFEIVELKDKVSGDVKEMVNYNGRLVPLEVVQKHYTGDGKPLATMVPYTQESSSEGIAKRYEGFGEKSAKSIEDIYRTTLPKTKEGAQVGRENLPSESRLSQEMTDYLSKRGIDLNNTAIQNEFNGIKNNAVEDMLREHAANKTTKIQSIIPFLENARIKKKAGNLDEGLFYVGDKLMSVPKRMELYQLAKLSLPKDLSIEDQDVQAAKQLSQLAAVWSNPTNGDKLRRQFSESKNNSAFFNFAMKQLKPEQKK
jgi:hypothetical protein